jgi:hypothetical protein
LGVTLESVSARVGAWASRPASPLSVGLVRFARCEAICFEGTPLGHPARGLRTRYACLVGMEH